MSVLRFLAVPQQRPLLQCGLLIFITLMSLTEASSSPFSAQLKFFSPGPGSLLLNETAARAFLAESSIEGIFLFGLVVASILLSVGLILFLT